MKNWNNHDPCAMAKIILDSLMPLEQDEERLVKKALNDYETQFNIYELYDLNVLCHMSQGFLRNETDKKTNRNKAV